MDGLRVVRIAEQFPPLAGGLAPGMLALTLEQHRRGYQVTVITREAAGSAACDRSLPFPVIRVPARSLLQLGWRAADVLADLPEPPDVVHCHGPAAAPVLLRKRRGDPPVVLTLHALRRYQYSAAREALQEAQRGGELPAGQQKLTSVGWSPKVARELALERFLCSRADHLALVAGYFQPLLERYYGVPPMRCTVIYNGSQFGQATDRRPDPETPLVLYVGRLDWVKRAHLLVQAMPTVLQAQPLSRLLVVGDGELRGELEELVVRLGVGEAVQFVGWVDHTELASMYRDASCLCLPSIWEGLPKVVLEAMSVGLPVIASAIPAHAEVLEGGDLGDLVERGSPSAWAAAIIRLLEQPAIAADRAQRAAAAVEDRYRWSHVAGRVEKAYREVIGE